MRDVPDVIKAQNGQDVHTNTITVNALPPAYMKGFTLTDRDGQLVVSPGIANIKGTRVSLRDEYIISGDDYLASDNIIPNLFYTVYVNKEAEFIVDSVDPVKDLNYYSFYHPTRQDYRYIGQFFKAESGAHQQIVSYDPLGFNSLSTNLVDTLLLSVQTYLSIGYTGQGTLDNPVEGDKYMYIDGDEINVLEYAGGAWYAKLRFGGEIAGNFVAQIQGNTVNHIDNTVINTEQFPTKNFQVFTFDNTYDDQNGNDDWLGKADCGFTTAWSKFGARSLYESGPVGILYGPFYGDVGESVAMASYVKINYTGTGFIGVMGLVRAPNDQIAIGITPTSQIIDCLIKKGGSTLQGFSISYKQFGGLENVHYLGFTYDSTTDTLSLIVNNVIKTVTGFTGTWTPSQTWQIQVDPYTSGGEHIYFSELATSYVDYVNPQVFASHYNNNLQWQTDVSRADQAIYCAPGGRIQFIDHMPEESLGTLHIIPIADRYTNWVVSGIATTWTDIDFSTWVPVGVKALLLKTIHYNYGAGPGINVLLRPKGSTDAGTTVNTIGPGAYINAIYQNYQQTVIDCDPEGFIQYRVIGSCRLYANIMGYYI